ncbi:hypothetical protein QBC36DRAFT_22228 [Triangularia setosa]|uniref:Uncharacterized protein n=1 Tax=Triangularia setosa TaxID=2587417 RepID=A0AAN7A678_9PEZI|nr:hypothetical protein QBC36DRAFT_22228 [Podospora setosa]
MGCLKCVYGTMGGFVRAMGRDMFERAWFFLLFFFDGLGGFHYTLFFKLLCWKTFTSFLLLQPNGHGVVETWRIPNDFDLTYLP